MAGSYTSRLSAVDVTMPYLVPMPRGLICLHRWTLELLSLMKLSLAKADGCAEDQLITPYQPPPSKATPASGALLARGLSEVAAA